MLYCKYFDARCIELAACIAILFSGCGCKEEYDPESTTYLLQYYKYVWLRSDSVEVSRLDIKDPAVRLINGVIVDGEEFKSLSTEALQGATITPGVVCANIGGRDIHFKLTLKRNGKVVAIIESYDAQQVSFLDTCDREVSYEDDAVFWQSLNRLITRFAADHPDAVSVTNIDSGEKMEWSDLRD